MSHAIWKGHLSFGLINISISLFSAEKSNELHFNLLDSKSHNKVKYERIDDKTGKAVPWNAIVKGYEYKQGQYVILTNEDFKSVAGDSSKVIEIDNFIPKESISSVFFEIPYYMLPDKNAEKGYVLFREILNKTKKIAIGRIMIRSRQHLAAIMPFDDAVILNIMRYEEDLKKPSEFDFPRKNTSEYKITKDEMEIAEQLVESMTTVWKPAQYKDEYSNELLKLIQKKAKKDRVSLKKSKTIAIKQTNRLDFLELLQQSLKQKKKALSSKRESSKTIKDKKKIKKSEPV